MAAQAAQQAYNIGRDGATLNIVSNGTPLKPTILTNFKSQREVKQLRSDPLNAPPIFQNAQPSWKGSFEVDRADSTLDAYFAAQDTGFYNGEDALVVSILQTIQDAAVGAVGATHQFLYTGVVLNLENAGAYKADEKVIQEVSFVASTRIQVS